MSWHRHGGQGAQPILDVNQREAERNRGYFRARGILALNLVSSPGSGKTTLLQATLERLQPRVGCAVVVGDLETQADAEALRPSGAPVVQITTGTVCHLDARMVAAAVDALPKEGVRLLFIENVGNLVCPASFDLGEAHRIVLLAATEGENKPLKYPPIFHGARAVVISKTDLAEPAGFDHRTRPPSHRASRPRGGNPRTFRAHRRRASTPGSPSLDALAGMRRLRAHQPCHGSLKQPSAEDFQHPACLDRLLGLPPAVGSGSHRG